MQIRMGYATGSMFMRNQPQGSRSCPHWHLPLVRAGSTVMPAHWQRVRASSSRRMRAAAGTQRWNSARPSGGSAASASGRGRPRAGRGPRSRLPGDRLHTGSGLRPASAPALPSCVGAGLQPVGRPPGRSDAKGVGQADGGWGSHLATQPRWRSGLAGLDIFSPEAGRRETLNSPAKSDRSERSGGGAT